MLAIADGLRGDPLLQPAGERHDAAIAVAMETAAFKAGYPGRVRVLQPSTRGAHVVQARSAAPPAAAVSYVSTRGSGAVGFEEAVMLGLAADGGLYVPDKVGCPSTTLAYYRHLQTLPSLTDCRPTPIALYITWALVLNGHRLMFDC